MSDPIGAPIPTAPAFAGWLHRFAALIVDSVPTAVLFTVLAVAFGDTETTDSSFSFQLTGWPFGLYLVLSLAWFVYNWIHLQGSTGQTVGKKALDISVVTADTHQPIGGGLTFARQLCHILDWLPCFLGYLWPLWDKEKRTFADMLMSTRVIKV